MSDLEKRITAKMVLDDSGYSSTLKGINAELKENKSELRAASSGLEAFGKTSANINRVQESFSKQLETQTRKIKAYQDAMNKASANLEKNISTRDKLKTSIAQEESKLEALKRQYGENNEAVARVDSRLEELREELERVNSSVENNAKRMGSYQSNLNKAESELNKTTTAHKKFNDDLEKSGGLTETERKLSSTSDRLGKFGDKASSVGGSLTMGLTMPLVGVGLAAAHVGMDFESQMSRVQAISGATGSDLESLKNQALDLGQKTKFSAGQAAEGMENLASAGFNTKEIMEAMPGMLDLAASSGEDLATSSDIAASTLRGFGLAASDAGHVADVLAKNASETNAAVADTGEAMKYVAPVAHSMGLSLEEVTASIGEMANAGIKGSQAGTTLRGALTRLAKPTDDASATMKQLGFNAFDSSGKMKPLSTIVGELKEKTVNLTDKQKQQAMATIFGQEAMSGMLTLVDAGPQQLENLTNGLKDSTGAANEMAKTMQDNTKASVEQALGSLETAGIKLLQVAAPAIKSVAESVENLANKFSNLSPATQEFILKAGMVALAAGPVIGTFGKLTKGVSGTIKVVSTVGKAFGFFGGAAEVAGAAAGGLGSAVAGAGTATGVASGAVAGLGTAVAGIAAPLAIGAVAVAGVGYAGYKTAEYLNSSATPAVDLFADKAVYSSQTVVGASGAMTMQVQTDTIKISKATKDAVGAYMDLDKKASSNLMQLQMNSDNFTKATKDTVLKNFTDMSKKATNLSKQQKDNMTVNFQKLVSDTGVLTKKNKDEIIKQYTDMVNGTKGLTAKQKAQTIKDFTDTLNKSVALTKKQSTDLQNIYKNMNAKIQAGLDKKRATEIKAQTEFFAKSNALSAQEEAEALSKTNQFWDSRKQKANETEQKIISIIQNAANNHRQITSSEAQEIGNLQNQMKENAVKTLSANEVESKVILERMKGNSTNITAQMASDNIKKLNELRDNSIKSANEECDKRIAEAIRMRDETKVISADQANKLIEDAKRQRDGTVQAAEETRNQAVGKITSMNSEISSDVNTTTGEVKSNWDKLKDWWANWNPLPKIFKFFTEGSGDAPQQHYSGTSYFKGGLTTLHERGEELYDLPTGTRIYNHEMSENMVLETARKTAEGIVKQFGANQEQGDIIIPISIAGEKLDDIIIPRVSNKLAMNSRRRF